MLLSVTASDTSDRKEKPTCLNTVLKPCSCTLDRRPPTRRPTHSQLTDEELLDQGIKPNTIRLSIGTEHIDDILADLERGFDAVREG